MIFKTSSMHSKEAQAKSETCQAWLYKRLDFLGSTHIVYTGTVGKIPWGYLRVSLGPIHCRLKGVNILNNLAVFPFEMKCLPLATKRNGAPHSAIQEISLCSVAVIQGPGCCPKQWRTLACMWCCFFTGIECKGYKVMEASFGLQRKALRLGNEQEVRFLQPVLAKLHNLRAVMCRP